MLLDPGTALSPQNGHGLQAAPAHVASDGRDSGVQLRPPVPARVAESPAVRPGGRRADAQTARPGPSAEREALSRRQKRHPEEPGQFAVALVIVYRTLGQLLPELYDPDRRSLR